MFGAALVELAGRVQEARAVAQRGRVARPVAAGAAHAGQRGVARRGAQEVGAEARCSRPASPSPECARMPIAVAHGSQASSGAPGSVPLGRRALRQQRAGRDLRLGDVGLVERVDAQRRARRSRSRSPSGRTRRPAPRADRRRCGPPDARRFSSAVTAASCLASPARRPDVDEEAVVAVALRRARAARDRPGRCPCPPCPMTRRPAARSTSRSWRCSGEITSVSLSRPAAAAAPERRAQLHAPGSPRAARRRPRRPRAPRPRRSARRCRRRSSAAGTSPKYDSAE